MTLSEAIELAGLKAKELNIPWSSKAVQARRRHVWPFSPFWRVVAYIESENATVTMLVHERTQQATALRILYRPKQLPRPQLRYLIVFAIKLAMSGRLFWLFVRYGFGWPVWAATLLAVPRSYLGVVIYHACRAPRLPPEENLSDRE